MIFQTALKSVYLAVEQVTGCFCLSFYVQVKAKDLTRHISITQVGCLVNSSSKLLQKIFAKIFVNDRVTDLVKLESVQDVVEMT